jgi:asparagine N-glycosylation enzyme membrane subunit Stt3
MQIPYKEEIESIVKNKKVQIGLTIVLFLIVLYFSTALRFNNLPVLKDQTTGLYTSNDLDSLYFYRIAETKMNNGGVLPPIDVLRSPAYNITWFQEILPDVLILMYKIEKIFSPSITFDYSAAISGPIIFAMILVAFFILSLLLIKSKIASLIASAFLAFSPAFLFRSVAGFYDHDHLGVLAILLCLICLFFGFKLFERSWKQTILWGILLGFFTTLIFVSWGGAITFIFVLIPLTALIFYLFGVENKEKFIALYFLWIIFSVLCVKIFGFSFSSLANRYLNSEGIAVLFFLGFIIIDYILEKFRERKYFEKIKYKKLSSLIITFILGIFGLILIKKNPIYIIKEAWATLIFPFFGTFAGRVGSTVAENAQPYLVDLISQVGKPLFYLFLLGLIFLGFAFAKKIGNKKYKVIGFLSWIALCFGILFSRTSSSIKFLNGESIISQAIYLIGALSFFGFLFFIEIKEKIILNKRIIIFIAIAITLMINARAAIRSFFLITPFICLIAGYSLCKMIDSFKKIKEEISKYIVIAGIILVFILTFYYLFGNPINNTPGNYNIISEQAKYVGASANEQWQNAMAWARNNTKEGEIFVHWWDYGYFVQNMANRPTVTDGGHSGGSNTDFYIGRDILTTPNPKTAYSFMKTWNVSYLLIDPTEIGKYGAYSKIGSNDSWDRFSTGPSVGVTSEQNIKETSTGVIKIYSMGGCVDEDIKYQNIFLPGLSVSKTQNIVCNSYLAGIIVEMNAVENNSVGFKQPEAVFVYNNQQIKIPIKNLYFNGQRTSFEGGIDAVAYIIPSIDSQGQLDQTGAIIYLSPRVFNSLIGKLYILGDYYKEYGGLELVKKEQDPVVTYFNQYLSGKLGDFVYYQGLRAPLKIWKVDYPEETQTHQEFLQSNFTYGGLDYYFT